MNTPALTLTSLNAYYGKRQILHSIHAAIPKNQITAIIGPSGCGKSTLLKCLNRMITEEQNGRMEGTILLDNTDTASMKGEYLRRRIGLVFQTPTPFPLSVYKNMTYAPLYYGGMKKRELDDLVREKLIQAGLYEEVKDQLHKNALLLSGGQQQRLCIARALTVNPEILLLDEPCSALDIRNTQRIESLLVDLKQHYTILIVTHNLGQARRIADHVLFLQDGCLIEDGSADELFHNPKNELTRKFTAGEF